MQTQRKRRTSPARIELALATLWSHYNGRLKQLNLTLNAGEYKRLLQRLEQPENRALLGHFYDRFRYHYTRSNESFEIKIPIYVCQRLSMDLYGLIGRWSDAIFESSARYDKRIGDAAFSIYGISSKPIHYFTGDGQDIGWAQNSTSLAETAKSYIRGSNGITRTVVTFGMHRIYQAEERNVRRKCVEDEEFETDVATFSVWRANDDGEPIQTVANQVFRDKEGMPVASVALEISLKDFICRGILASPEGAFKDPVLRFTSEELCRRLNRALMEYHVYRKDDFQEYDSDNLVLLSSNRRLLKRIKKKCVGTPKARRMTAQLGPIIEDGKSRSAKFQNVYIRKSTLTADIWVKI
ncbi:hypothetical protein FHL15_008550 [Xylaria flabelliformis]|uniref:Uncharacterized protein n=1 Tax=Xylaria flabelliformis TaxID=2512241 RepID=A0A553HRI8_9PEZI|nr:hypothetical protein FHL15_008550 [Xylaria flabelliformis]